MDERALHRIQTQLRLMEERNEQRMDTRFDTLERKVDLLEVKIDSLSREVRLNNELLEPFIRWSHQVENEVIRLNAALQDVQARLAKLENPQPTA